MDRIGKASELVTLQRFRAAWAVALIAALTGCSTTPKVYSDYNTAVNFNAYKTFAVLTPRASGAGIDPGAAMRLTQPVQQTVREALTAKGMTEVAREQADFAVSVRGESIPKIEVTDMGYTAYPYPYGASRAGWAHYGAYGGYGGYGGYNSGVSVRETTERKLIVEIFDNASRQEAWVGWMEKSGGSVDTEKLLAGLRLILGGFPPVPEAPK